MIYMPILNVCNLCKTYQAGEAEVKALDNVSFTHLYPLMLWNLI